MTTPLIVTGVRAEACDVLSFELRDPDGKPLAPFSPGAHLEIDVPTAHGPGLIRHYSISSDWRDADHYVVTVARAAGSRGGSIAMHHDVRVGTTLEVRGPRNHFPLDTEAESFRFIAGGIGITPIMSMVRWCTANNKSWSLLYCARSKNRAAFYDQLSSMTEHVRFHFDDEHGAPPNIAAELGQLDPRDHVYCCGPTPLMDRVREHCADRDPDSVHFEWFSADPSPQLTESQTGEFDIVLRRRGARAVVPPDRSILDILEELGVDMPNSCREGVCGTCETTVCAGEVDHRDHVLTPSEKAANQTMMVCVSRAASATLELDI